MTIISQLIEYVEKYPSDEKHSKLNLIFIEEPEAFMHPQMQELFIKNINAAVKKLLDGSSKKINSQLIVTTHSSHILNSKIHESNSFNNINYIATLKNIAHVINLNDETVINNSENSESRIKNLTFLKKHIQFKVSDIFFSDAVIFVEGVTEETLLTYHINNDPNLKKYYITVVNINGAHGMVYHDLIKLIKIPALIITDLDIKRSKAEKSNFVQMNSLNGLETTNPTIIKFNNNNEKIDQLTNNFFLVDNIYVASQVKQINGYHPTSFEESYILNNYENAILNKVLLELKPDIYKSIVDEDENSRILENLVKNSYKLQRKLSKSKSDFSNTLLYEFINSDNSQELPNMPEYIVEGLAWLQKQLTHNPQVNHEPN
jgi:predicted ATP-dependent endonuclease of OLD family